MPVWITGMEVSLVFVVALSQFWDLLYFFVDFDHTAMELVVPVWIMEVVLVFVAALSQFWDLLHFFVDFDTAGYLESYDYFKCG